LRFAEAHAARHATVSCVANLAQAALLEAHARLAARGEWVLNEKRLIAQAGLDAVAEAVASCDVERVRAALSG
jgi:hypothetical protein